jgi:NAD(P)-dependent dehydrogenase (short-subunit alcohol dehydrogenase family)
VRLDVSDERNIEALAAQLNGQPIDILINNAGVGGEGRSIAGLEAAELQRVMMINAIAPILVTKQLLPNLRAGRRRIIVNITSQLGSIASNNGGSSYSYRGSKAALNMLTVSLANELAPDGFTCVAVHPGWVRTAMGGENAPISPQQSAKHLLDLIERLTPADNGSFLNHDGGPLPW